MTPRKLRALVAVHVEVNGGKDEEEKPKMGYIDQLF